MRAPTTKLEGEALVGTVQLVGGDAERPPSPMQWRELARRPGPGRQSLEPVEGGVGVNPPASGLVQGGGLDSTFAAPGGTPSVRLSAKGADSTLQYSSIPFALRLAAPSDR